jgi:hypothetical protein
MRLAIGDIVNIPGLRLFLVNNSSRKTLKWTAMLPVKLMGRNWDSGY